MGYFEKPAKVLLFSHICKKKVVFCFKNEKKSRKIWSCQKKAVLLQPILCKNRSETEHKMIIRQ